MKFSHIPSPAEATTALLLLSTPATSMLNCKKVVANGKQFDLSALGGPHSVTVSQLWGGHYLNTTYTTDICAGLKRKGDVKREQQCPLNTRVCAIEHNVDGKTDTFNEAFPVAGELKGKGGNHLDHEAYDLSSSDSNADSAKKGVRLILKGGFREMTNTQTRWQRAIIEFECDPDLEGTEGEWKSEDEYVPGEPDFAEERRVARSLADPLFYAAEDGDEDTRPNLPVQLGANATQALKFVSYGPLESDDKIDILRMTWKTKYACPGTKNEGEQQGSGSGFWNFFVWMVILGFLGTATYLIFGAWLNYNRYGARGWDLLPHGDTIRDIPYLMKDWTRRVLNTVQGPGGRGGYSAV